jgi:hypothetical protein
VASVVARHFYFLAGRASRVFAAIAKNLAQGNPNFSIRRHVGMFLSDFIFEVNGNSIF